MKTLRRTCAATILSLMLAVSAFAGHIETPGAVSTGNGPTSNISTTIVSDRGWLGLLTPYVELKKDGSRD
jgi:hypothetical protein